MRRPQPLEAPPRHLVETPVIVAHVAVRRAHHRGRPAHDVIAREQGVLFHKRIADVVGGVAGGGHRLQGPAWAGDAVAVSDSLVRREGVVMPFVELHRGVGDMRRGQAQHHRAGLPRQGGGQGRMIEVGVGHQDGRHPLAAHRLQDRLQMRGQRRTGIDHSHLAMAHQIGPRAGEGERPRIARDDAPDQRRDLVGPAIGEVHLPDEWDHRRRFRPGPCAATR